MSDFHRWGGAGGQRDGPTMGQAEARGSRRLKMAAWGSALSQEGFAGEIGQREMGDSWEVHGSVQQWLLMAFRRRYERGQP